MGREVKLLTGSDFFHGDAPTNSEERKGGIITTCACLAFALELPMTICKKSLVAGETYRVSARAPPAETGHHAVVLLQYAMVACHDEVC
jgi:hypothetical protein